jgi:hypothetical protein
MNRFPKAKPDAAGAEIARLDPQTLAIWRLADGATAVEAIAEALGADREPVWAALDRLHDRGLLEARVTPPAGAAPLSRRGVLGTVARGAGWLGLAAAGAAAPAFAADEHSQEQANKRTHEKLLAAQEEEKKHRERADEQQQKRRNLASEEAEKKRTDHAREENKKRDDRASEERKKHGGPTLDQAEEQKIKRGGKPQ